MANQAGKKKQAPLRRAAHWGSEIPGMIGRLALMTLGVVIMGFLFGAMQGISITWLRLGLTALASAAALAFYFNEGLGKGSTDASASRQAARIEKQGRQLTAKEEAACYHPLKALCAALAFFGLPLLLAAYVGAVSPAYTYDLQDLPAWLTGSYAVREDVMAPVTAYMTVTSGSLADVLRVIVRMFVLVFVGLFEDPQRMSQLIDRCVPLFLLVYVAVYMLGYLRGPAEFAKLEKMNKKAKKVAVRKQQKKNLTEQLLGENRVPHYGQQRDKDKPKKKELI